MSNIQTLAIVIPIFILLLIILSIQLGGNYVVEKNKRFLVICKDDLSSDGFIPVSNVWAKDKDDVIKQWESDALKMKYMPIIYIIPYTNIF